jgi:hypothetical protein
MVEMRVITVDWGIDEVFYEMRSNFVLVVIHRQMTERAYP